MDEKSKWRELVWAIYDFADTIFSMNVVSLYFPLLIVSELGGKDIYVGIANSISQVMVIIAAPLLGVISDRSGKRMPFLTISATLCALGTIAIGISAKFALILPVLASFITANFFYQLSLTFYNSLLPRVGPANRWGKISGLGTALGYVGSIVGMVLIMPFNTGKFFGLSVPIPSGGRIATFFPTAILFSLFALPTILYFYGDELKKQYPVDITKIHPVKKILQTFSDSKKYPGLRRFIIGRFFFQESVETAIIFMGIFAEKVMGLPDNSKIIFFIIATTSAVIGSFVWGRITDILKPHRTLTFVLTGWVIGLTILALFPNSSIFYIIGCWLGMMLGGVWTSSRPYILKIAPPENVGRFFGLYSLSGKAAAVTGPLLWGAVILFLGKWNEIIAYRLAVVMLALLILVGMFIIYPNSKIEDL
ncbi:hypothetical protein DRQ33_06735 [bacterium]|nr:MAG: hypothetical protein DRQ33_06735 [bacterium]